MKSFKTMLAGTMLGLAVASPAYAIKPFTLLEDGYAERVGAFELEQTLSVEHQVKGNPGFLGLEHEIEFETGLKEDFTFRVAGAYNYEHSTDGDSMHFSGFKLEGQYYFSSPVTDKVGLSLIGSVTAGENTLTYEAIFVAQRDFDKLTLAYNLGVATTLDGVFDAQKTTSVEGSFSNGIAAMYDIGHNVKVGGEISEETILPDWSGVEKTNVYAGPCVNWVPADNLWITVGVSYNVSGHTDEPRVIGSIILGYYFN